MEALILWVGAQRLAHRANACAGIERLETVERRLVSRSRIERHSGYGSGGLDKGIGNVRKEKWGFSVRGQLAAVSQVLWRHLIHRSKAAARQVYAGVPDVGDRQCHQARQLALYGEVPVLCVGR